MSQNHIVPPYAHLIATTKRIVPYWSVEPAENLIVFVHGFMGHATTTWNQFGRMLPSLPECRNCDLLFYGYDGFRHHPVNSAGVFRQALDKLLSTPASVINATLSPNQTRRASFKYKRVVLVSHSMGAVVTRRALLDAHDLKRPWVKSTRLVLFAPAHMGADVIELGSQLVTFVPYVGKLLSPAARIWSRPLRALDPGNNKDTTLKDLKSDTERATRGSKAKYLLAHEILMGDGDNVVLPARFCSDPPLTVVPNRNHINICKPDGAYQEPVQAILRCLT